MYAGNVGTPRRLLLAWLRGEASGAPRHMAAPALLGRGPAPWHKVPRTGAWRTKTDRDCRGDSPTSCGTGTFVLSYCIVAGSWTRVGTPGAAAGPLKPPEKYGVQTWRGGVWGCCWRRISGRARAEKMEKCHASLGLRVVRLWWFVVVFGFRVQAGWSVSLSLSGSGRRVLTDGLTDWLMDDGLHAWTGFGSRWFMRGGHQSSPESTPIPFNPRPSHPFPWLLRCPDSGLPMAWLRFFSSPRISCPVWSCPVLS